MSEYQQQDLFMSPVLMNALNHSDRFTEEFLRWLPDNLHVWNAFAREALAVIHKGFQHYSARTIIHVLRHHSALHEVGGEWKLNNNISPYLARLFDLTYPSHAGLFEFRETKKVTVEKGMDTATKIA